MHGRKNIKLRDIVKAIFYVKYFTVIDMQAKLSHAITTKYLSVTVKCQHTYMECTRTHVHILFYIILIILITGTLSETVKRCL